MQHKSLGFMQLAIICGFSFYYAWYLISFFALFVSPPAIATFVEVHVGQVVFFGASVLATLVTLVLFRRSNSSIIGHAKLLILATAVLGLALPVLVMAGNLISFASLPLFYGACFLSGASMAIGFMLWENLSTQGYLNKGVLAHGTIFCAGGIVFLCAALFLSNLDMSLLASLLLIASTALLAFITPRCNTTENKPIEPVRDYFRKVWNIDVVVVVLNISFGYAFILLFGYDKTLLVATMAAAVAADLIFSIIFGRGKWLLFAGSVRVCVAFASCALILLVLPGEATSLGALCVLVVFWFIFRTINGGSLTDLANAHSFPVLYSSTRGKLSANAGFTIGLGLGVAAVAAAQPGITTTYIPLALVAAFIFTALFLLPFDGESATAGYKTLALVDMHVPYESGIKRICESATEQYRLSPRESEVLEYLVKGRNAKHAAEKLFLSESTVKTHISNIYRKTGVHSQQELLDKLDKI